MLQLLRERKVCISWDGLGDLCCLKILSTQAGFKPYVLSYVDKYLRV